jgi:aromatic ring-cleaving dioxygenase
VPITPKVPNIAEIFRQTFSVILTRLYILNMLRRNSNFQIHFLNQGSAKLDWIELDRIGLDRLFSDQSDQVLLSGQSDQVNSIKFFLLGNPIRIFQDGLPKE